MFGISSMIEHLNILYQHSKDLVFFMQQTTNGYEYVYTNQSAEQMLGCNPKGKILLDLLPVENGVFISKQYDLAIAKQTQIEFEDYSYFQYNIHKHETTVIPLHFDDSNYLLATTKEIAFDRESEDQYIFMRSVFFKTFLSTVLVKKDGTLVEANPTFLQSFNFTMDKIRGLKITDLPIFTDRSTRQMNDLLSKDIDARAIKYETSTLSFKGKSDDFYTYTVTLSPIFRDKEITGYFIIFQDITAYMLQHEKLKKVSQGLEIFKNALNYTTDMIILNDDFTISEVNDKFMERTGYKQCELLGQKLEILDSNYHPKEFFDHMWETVLNGIVWRGEIRNRKKSGELYWVDSTVIPLTDEHGTISQFILIQINVSDKKQMMIDLHNIERTFRLITENTDDFIAILDRHGKVKYSSPSYIRKLGYSETQFENMPYYELLHQDCTELWNELMNNPNLVEKDGKLELKLQSAQGDIIWTEGNYTFVYDGNSNEPEQMIMVSREITERKKLEDSLMFLAYHDSLTQLPNRRYLKNEFPLFVDRANARYESFAVLYIDGDRFKQVNDLYGHDVGDLFLIQFAKALLKSVRKNDLVIRVGGDEFLVLISNLSRNESELIRSIQTVKTNISEQLKIGWKIGDTHFTPTASIGVSVYPQNGVTLDELVDYADRALYKKKHGTL